MNKYPLAPVHVLDGINRYVERGIAPGDFARAVLANDLTEAVGLADDASLGGLVDVVAYVRWEIPARCHGSWDRVWEWEEGGGDDHD